MNDTSFANWIPQLSLSHMQSFITNMSDKKYVIGSKEKTFEFIRPKVNMKIIILTVQLDTTTNVRSSDLDADGYYYY